MDNIHNIGYSNERIRPTRMEVNLDNLVHNLQQIKMMAGANAMICASMKANAYGHGAARVAAAVLENGADRLSVAFLDEALELRGAGIAAPVLILGALEKDGAREVVANGLGQTVSTFAEAKALSDTAARLNIHAIIHIKVDTGMGRLGFLSESPSVLDDIIAACSLPHVFTEGIFTHFASSDEADAGYTERQLRTFNDICGGLKSRGLDIPIRHCSNSAAINGFRHASLDMVRPGIALYGGAGVLPGAHHSDARLRRVMSLKTRVALVKKISTGTSVGYNRRFIAGRDSVIATLPLGYGDGYNRGLSCGKGEILINGTRSPVAGLICMDQCMADVTDAGVVNIGDEAVLYGKQGDDEITLEEVSRTLNTIPYEIMCAVSRRVPRVYVQMGRP